MGKHGKRQIGDGGFRPLRRYAAAGLVLCVGAALSGFSFAAVRKVERDRLWSEFERSAYNSTAAITKETDSRLLVVRSLGSFLGSSNELARGDIPALHREFRMFAHRLFWRHPSIQALGWIPRVNGADREVCEAAAKDIGHAGFRITDRQTQGVMVTSPRREEHFPVYFVEPLKGNEAAVGFDLSSNPARLKAMHESCDSGEMVATGRVTLVQETEGQFGFLVLMPVYQHGARTQTTEDRRKGLRGFALGVFRVGDIVDGAMARIRPEGINLRMFDRSAAATEQFLCSYSRSSRARASSADASERPEFIRATTMRSSYTFDVAGRKWAIVCTPTEEFVSGGTTWQPWVNLTGGLVLTGTLVFYLAASAAHAARIASGNVALAEEVVVRRQAEEKLRATEDRLRKQNTVLSAMTGLEALRTADSGAVFKAVTEAAARTLGVDRSSVWLFNNARSKICCADLYERGPDRHSGEGELVTVEYPVYFGAIECSRVLAADDARGDPRTREFAESYLIPLGITSMLDAPIRLDGQVVGVICQEHVGPARNWTPEEQSFVGSLADLVCLTLEIAERRCAEQILRQSERRYQRLLGSVTDYICSVTVEDGRAVSTSHAPGCVAVTGYTSEEYQADPFLWYRMIHEADRQAVKEYAEAILSGKDPRPVEHRILHKDGSVRWICNTPVVRKDENGQVVSYDALISDITVRKQAEEEVRHSYQMQTALYDLLQLAMENVSMEELLRRFIERVLGLPWLPLQPRACVFLIEDDPELLVMKAQQGLGRELLEVCRRVPLGRCLCGQAAKSREVVFADGVDARHDNRYPGISPHGHYCVPVISSSDSLLGVLNLYVAAGHRRQEEEQAFLQAAAKVLAGIIERKRAEEELRTSRELLEQRVAERTKELLEANRQIRQAQADLVQAEKMGMLGQLVAGVAHEINTPTGAIMNVAADSMGHLRELAQAGIEVLELPAEVTRWLADTIPHVLSRPTVVSEIADRGKRREIEHELREQGVAGCRRMAEAMAACGLKASDRLAVRSMAEESVLVFLEHLTALKASSEICHVSVQKIARIVRALRYYSRCGEGETFDVNVNESIDNTLVILQNRVKGVAVVERRYQESLPALRLGPDISQVWTNILSNACDAVEIAGGGERGLIRIATMAEGGDLTVEIFNAGPPIPEDLMTRIFDPFFTTKPIGKGTGLGLSICTGILQKYGGRLTARNDAGGVTFRVSLPLTRRDDVKTIRPAEGPAEEAAQTVSGGGAQ